LNKHAIIQEVNDMKKILSLSLSIAMAILLSLSVRAEAPKPKIPLQFSPDKPQLLVTAEYMTVEQLTAPQTMALLKKYNVLVAPCIRAGKLDANLDRLFTIYEQQGITIVFWPLLPREQGLYLNKEHADDFYNYLDQIYSWAEKYNHPVQALIVDIEPPNYQKGTDESPEANTEGAPSFGSVLKGLSIRKFNAAKPKFMAIQDKLHQHGTIAISTALDLSVVDLVTHLNAFQDLQGGPTMSVDWDYVSFMHFGSNNYPTLSKLGFNWDDCRYLSYRIGQIIYQKYGDKVAVSTGQTLPGEGHGAIYESADELAKDIEVLKAAGIKHFGIYDLQGIVESKDPESWLKAVRETPAKKPQKKSLKAECFLRNLEAASFLLEMFRLI